MIQLEKKENGKNAKVLTSYPDQITMEIASEMLAENYRKELSKKNGNTIYIADLEQAIELGLKSEWFEGAGYYKDGECLLLDSTKSLTTIREDVYTWELVEVPNPVENKDNSSDFPEYDETMKRYADEALDSTLAAIEAGQIDRDMPKPKDIITMREQAPKLFKKLKDDFDRKDFHWVKHHIGFGKHDNFERKILVESYIDYLNEVYNLGLKFPKDKRSKDHNNKIFDSLQDGTFVPQKPKVSRFAKKPKAEKPQPKPIDVNELIDRYSNKMADDIIEYNKRDMDITKLDEIMAKRQKLIEGYKGNFKHLTDAIDKVDVDELTKLLHSGNKNYKKFFQEYTREKLPYTDKGTKEVIENWSKGKKSQPETKENDNLQTNKGVDN